MTPQKELICNTGQFVDQKDHIYDVIFNRLDLPLVTNGKKLKFDPDEIRTVLPLFKESHLVFANIHPQKIGELPLEDALSEVNGRIIGTPHDVLVNNTGTLFRGSVYVDDPEAEELIRSGKAMLSTSFYTTPDSSGVMRNIVPNHILVYPSETGIMPGDHAAIFLTNQTAPANGSEPQRDQNMTENESAELAVAKVKIENQSAQIDSHKEKISTLSEELKESKTLITNQETEIKTLKEENTTLKTELESKSTLVTNQEGEITSLKSEVESYKTKLQEIKTAEKNARRLRIFNQYLPGTVKAFETRKDEILDDEKYEELIFAMNQYQAGVQVPPTKEEGTQITVANQSDDTPKFLNGVKFRYDASGKPIFEEA